MSDLSSGKWSGKELVEVVQSEEKGRKVDTIFPGWLKAKDPDRRKTKRRTAESYLWPLLPFKLRHCEG